MSYGLRRSRSHQAHILGCETSQVNAMPKSFEQVPPECLSCPAATVGAVSFSALLAGVNGSKVSGQMHSHQQASGSESQNAGCLTEVEISYTQH